MINLQAIRYFEIVARYEHYTRAANELYITQPCFFRNIYMVWNQERQMTPPAKAFRRYILSAL